jgi:hypothetical protein
MVGTAQERLCPPYDFSKTTPCTVADDIEINGLTAGANDIRIQRISFDPSGKTGA